jgi:hypothetical protein
MSLQDHLLVPTFSPPKRKASRAAAALAAIAVVALGLTLGGGAAQAAGPSLVIDAGIAGNDATTVGTIENCIVVKKGTEFQMDIIVRDVANLLAWEVYLDYDPNVLIVTDQNVKLFLQAKAGSSVFDVSGRVPDDSGFHDLQAFDSSDPPTPGSGSGVLARVTFKAVGPGDSKVGFGSRDLNHNGIPGQGTLLRDVQGQAIGGTLFDGQQTDAEVAVGQDCPPGTVVAPAPEGPSSGGSFPWLIAGGIAAAVIAGAGVCGVVLLSRRNSRRTLSDDAS